jgi:hypothetical protein
MWLNTMQTITLEGVWKVLNKTNNLQKPNPPSLVGKGGFKAYLRFGERFGEGLIYTLKTFKTSS